jgi:hypothetical protein
MKIKEQSERFIETAESIKAGKDEDLFKGACNKILKIGTVHVSTGYRCSGQISQTLD